jgi:hypothetical protein
MKIYDCFPFYRELDLLELRFEELYDHVDHFVLVEANSTHQGNPKPFYYEDNKERYAKYQDKIIHIKVMDMPNHSDSWVNEGHHRDQIMQGIADAADDDLIMISDLDEIIRPEAIEYMKNSDQSLFALRMPLFNFKFNYMRMNPGLYEIWGMAARRNLLNDINPTGLRSLRFQFMAAPYQFKNDGCEVIEHGGWQFSNLGDSEWLKDKARNFAHSEINTPEFVESIDVDASIAAKRSWDRNLDSYTYEIVELDDYFPKTILNNKQQYQKYILDNPAVKTLALLPAYPYNS